MIQVKYPTFFSAKSLLQSASWADFQHGCAQRYTSLLVYPKFGRIMCASQSRVCPCFFSCLHFSGIRSTCFPYCPLRNWMHPVPKRWPSFSRASPTCSARVGPLFSTSLLSPNLSCTSLDVSPSHTREHALHPIPMPAEHHTTPGAPATRGADRRREYSVAAVLGHLGAMRLRGRGLSQRRDRSNNNNIITLRGAGAHRQSLRMDIATKRRERCSALILLLKTAPPMLWGFSQARMPTLADEEMGR